MDLATIFGASWIICGVAAFGISRSDNVNRAYKSKVLSSKINSFTWMRDDAYRSLRACVSNQWREYISWGGEWILGMTGPFGLVISFQERGIRKDDLPIGFKLRIPKSLKEDGFPLQVTDNRSK